MENRSIPQSNLAAIFRRGELERRRRRQEVWIPKSQISDWCDGPDDEPGWETTSIFISEWLAIEKEMV